MTLALAIEERQMWQLCESETSNRREIVVVLWWKTVTFCCFLTTLRFRCYTILWGLCRMPFPLRTVPQRGKYNATIARSSNFIKATIIYLSRDGSAGSKRNLQNLHQNKFNAFVPVAYIPVVCVANTFVHAWCRSDLFVHSIGVDKTVSFKNIM